MSTSRFRILVVDDSQAARVQVRQPLEAMGFDVVEAAEGIEALWRARQYRFDLVLTDVHMPSMDGLAFIRELRALPEYSKIPILVLTSDCSRERLREGREVGADGWIIKPISPKVLAEGIREMLMKPIPSQSVRPSTPASS